MVGGFFSILKNRDFSKIWLAQMLSQLSLNMINFALILRIYGLTGSITSVSLVLVASALPSVIFGPFSGVIADRLNYKTILTYTNFLRFFTVLLIIFANGNTLAVLEVLFIINVITQFFAPAESSSFPLIVSKEKLIHANSFSVATLYATILLGYSIAGPLFAYLGTPIFFSLCAVMYLISAVLVYNMSNYDKKEVRGLSLVTLASDIMTVWSETKAGVAYIYRDRKVFSPMIKFAIGWMILGAFIVLLPGFGETVLGIQASNVGWAIVGPAGAGMLIGAYFLQKRSNSLNKDMAVNIGYLVISLGLLALVLFPLYGQFFFAILIMVAATVLIGLGMAMIYIASQTLLHVNSDLHMRGRVFGVSSMLVNLAMAIPALLVGGLADLTTPLIAMGIVVLFLIVFSLYIYLEKPLSERTA